MLTFTQRLPLEPFLERVSQKYMCIATAGKMEMLDKYLWALYNIWPPDGTNIMICILDQNLTAGQCDGFPGPRAGSTWPVQALMEPLQCGTTRVDSLSVEQALRDMKMRFVYLYFVTSNRPHVTMQNKCPTKFSGTNKQLIL